MKICPFGAPNDPRMLFCCWSTAGRLKEKDRESKWHTSAAAVESVIQTQTHMLETRLLPPASLSLQWLYNSGRFWLSCWNRLWSLFNMCWINLPAQFTGESHKKASFWSHVKAVCCVSWTQFRAGSVHCVHLNVLKIKPCWGHFTSFWKCIHFHIHIQYIQIYTNVYTLWLNEGCCMSKCQCKWFVSSGHKPKVVWRPHVAVRRNTTTSHQPLQVKVSCIRNHILCLFWICYCFVNAKNICSI